MTPDPVLAPSPKSKSPYITPRIPPSIHAQVLQQN